MFISSKYEDIYSIEVKHVADITDNTYTSKQILEMEGKILMALEFDLTTVSSLSFLKIYS